MSGYLLNSTSVTAAAIMPLEELRSVDSRISNLLYLPFTSEIIHNSFSCIDPLSLIFVIYSDSGLHQTQVTNMFYIKVKGREGKFPLRKS